MMLTFEDYKSKVSIIQVLEDLGYKQDLKKGKLSPVFKLSDGTGNKIDEVVIRNPDNKSGQYYFDRNNKGGDLIAFIKNHINDFPQFHNSNEFVRLNMILGHYANVEYVPKYETYTSNASKQSFDLARFEVKPTTSLNDLSYLTNERNIHPDTVKTFLPFITRVTDTESKSNVKYANIAFPYKVPGTDTVTNYEQRNYNFSGMCEFGEKKESVWIADFSPNPQLTKNIYFAEGALDAMSFYQLNKDKLNLNESAFISVGGYLSPNQIKNTLAHFPNALTHTCFDNDLNGHLYDIKVHSIIANMEVDIKVQDNKVNFNTNTREFSILKDELSIEKFRQEAHSVAAMKVHKANGAKDFNDILKQSPKRLTLKL